MGSTQGQYTVKSGYQFWTSQITNTQSASDYKGWTKIWKLQVPPKVRAFFWRFCRNNVPVRKLIRGTGVSTTIICPLCEVDIEHMRHLLCEFPYVVGCWRQLDLNTHLQVVESAPKWLLEVISKGFVMVSEKVVVVLWGIWFARNKKVWEGKLLSPAVAMEISTQVVGE